jgi:hypothetical protein
MVGEFLLNRYRFTDRGCLQSRDVDLLKWLVGAMRDARTSETTEGHTKEWVMAGIIYALSLAEAIVPFLNDSKSPLPKHLIQPGSAMYSPLGWKVWRKIRQSPHKLPTNEHALEMVQLISRITTTAEGEQIIQQIYQIIEYLTAQNIQIQ